MVDVQVDSVNSLYHTTFNGIVMLFEVLNDNFLFTKLRDFRFFRNRNCFHEMIHNLMWVSFLLNLAIFQPDYVVRKFNHYFRPVRSYKHSNVFVFNTFLQSIVKLYSSLRIQCTCRFICQKHHWIFSQLPCKHNSLFFTTT